MKLSYSPARPSEAAARAPRTPARPLRARQRALILSGAAMVLGFIVFHFCAPALARALGQSLPASWVRDASQAMLTTLDERSVRPASAPPPPAFEQLQARFGQLIAPPAGAPPYRLVYRPSGNSDFRLATLPDGEILVSERFFATVPDPDQQLALLCVELGHLHYRHALNAAVAGTLLRLGTATLFEDEDASVRRLARGLARADYSPQMLRDADAYAQLMLQRNGFPARLLQSALSRAPTNTSPAQFNATTPSHEAALPRRLNALRGDA
ncbi:MAG: hypothetical protein REI09_09960 [Candidatus Dactylopiibacterium sp.]|nr:hypothetical protein [Candidatus Dactylopiibacterium sp.]